MSDISLFALWMQDEARLETNLNISMLIIYCESGNLYYHATWWSKI